MASQAVSLLQVKLLCTITLWTNVQTRMHHIIGIKIPAYTLGLALVLELSVVLLLAQPMLHHNFVEKEKGVMICKADDRASSFYL